jgi:hypothetical protein
MVQSKQAGSRSGVGTWGSANMMERIPYISSRMETNLELVPFVIVERHVERYRLYVYSMAVDVDVRCLSQVNVD